MYKFTQLENAQAFANRTKDMVIVLGCDNRYWVTTRREAARLEKQGYEVL